MFQKKIGFGACFLEQIQNFCRRRWQDCAHWISSGWTPSSAEIRIPATQGPPAPLPRRAGPHRDVDPSETVPFGNHSTRRTHQEGADNPPTRPAVGEPPSTKNLQPLLGISPVTNKNFSLTVHGPIPPAEGPINGLVGNRSEIPGGQIHRNFRRKSLSSSESRLAAPQAVKRFCSFHRADRIAQTELWRLRRGPRSGSESLLIHAIMV